MHAEADQSPQRERAVTARDDKLRVGAQDFSGLPRFHDRLGFPDLQQRVGEKRFRARHRIERAYLPVHERALLFYSIAALLLGAQMMSIGFLAELITAYQSRDEESYSIAETTAARPALPSDGIQPPAESIPAKH